MKWIGTSAATISAASLLAACDGDDAQDAGTADGDDDEVNDDPELDDGAADDEQPDVDDQGEAATDSDRPELTIAIEGLPGNLDAAQHTSQISYRVLYSIYDYLIERDYLEGDTPGVGDGLKPGIAESWERVDDMTFEVHLREDVLFHNGDPLTAEDVEFTFQRLVDDPGPEFIGAGANVSTITEVNVIDEHTVQFVTGAPDPIIEKRLSRIGAVIIPKDYYESVGMEEFERAPVTTGPYQVVDFLPDEHLILESFDDYWGDTPPASRVEFRVIPETAARVSAVVSGEVDIATHIPPDQIQTAEDADGVHVAEVPLANIRVVVYNTNHPNIEDKRIRQALNLAIDRELIIETLWGGRALHLRGLQHEKHGDMFNEDRSYTSYDPERAQELMEEAGYDGGEIRYYADPGYYTLGPAVGQAVVEMWNEVGFNATVVTIEDAQEQAGPDEMIAADWSNTATTSDPDGAVWMRWGPDQWPQAGHASWPEGEAHWHAPDRFNELGELQRQTLDQEERFEMIQEMLDIWEDEAPGTPLYTNFEFYIVRDGVNWQPYCAFPMDFRAYNLGFDD